MFWGYALHHKDYRCLDPLTNHVYISHHVCFHQSEFPFSSFPIRAPSVRKTTPFILDDVLSLAHTTKVVATYPSPSSSLPLPTACPSPSSPSLGLPFFGTVSAIEEFAQIAPSSTICYLQTCSPSTTPFVSSPAVGLPVLSNPAPHPNLFNLSLPFASSGPSFKPSPSSTSPAPNSSSPSQPKSLDPRITSQPTTNTHRMQTQSKSSIFKPK